MKFGQLIAFICFCTVIAVTAVAQQPDNVSTIVDRWVESSGGKENLQRIDSMYRKSEITFGGMAGTSQDWITRDGRWRNELELGTALKTTTVFRPDGPSYYRDTNGKVREVQGTNLLDYTLEAYLNSFSHLLPGRMQGKVSYEGRSADGKLILLKIQPEQGREATMFLDAQTYLPVRSEQPYSDRKFVTRYSDWRKVNGILMPHEIQSESGRDDLTVVKLIEVRINEKVDVALFQKPEEGAPDFVFEQGESAVNIPFELTSNHIYVPVQLNDSKETLWFILDTGADVSVLEAGTVERLGLTKEGAVSVGGAGEKTTQSSVLSNITFRVPGAEVRNQQAFSIPLQPLFKREGRRIDGILGYDFISRFVVKVDYASRKIDLYDPQSYTYNGPGEIVPVLMEGSSPYITVQIEAGNDGSVLTAKTMIDTGSRLAITLNKPFHEKHSLLKNVKTRVAPMGMGVGGATKDQVGRIASLQIGGLKFQDVITGFSIDQKGAGADKDSDANLGGEILRRFTLIIDYSRNRMIFEKNNLFGEPFEYDKTGILIEAEGEEFRTFKVVQVLTDSPAAEAGVEVGDVIVSAAEKTADEWNYEDLRQFFRQATTPTSIIVERAGKRIPINLKPRKII